MLLLNAALAFDQCPDPPRPHIVDLTVSCEQEELSLDIAVVDDGAPVDQALVQVWTATGQLTGTHGLTFKGYDFTDYPEGATLFELEGTAFDCGTRQLLRVMATNIAGDTGQRDRWLNSPIAIQNGGFEEDLWSWGVGGNAEVTWKQYGTDPLEPWSGNAMLMLGWPNNTYYVYGYAWQNLGELPAGDYQVDFNAALVVNPSYKTDWDANTCRSGSPEFFYGLNSYSDDDSMDNFANNWWSLEEKCAELDMSDDGWWAMTDWFAVSDTFTVPSGREDMDTFLWFNSRGQYSQWAHWVYVDEVYITPPATDIDNAAASVVPEAVYIGDDLYYPEEDTDYASWFYWDHFEDEVGEVYAGLCGSDCVAMSGDAGPEKTSSSDDVDGTWGLDSAILHMSDDSVLLIETKSTEGTCFPDTDEGLADAEEYIEQRREASESELEKCEYEDCAQMSARWIWGTIAELCAEEDDQHRLAARRIEEAWDDGTLYTSWAAVGFEPPSEEDEDCLTGWMLAAEAAPPKLRDEEICPEELE